MVSGLGEILEKASELKGTNAKVEYLQANSSASLKEIVGLTYDPNVVWALPEGKPPYKPAHKDQDLQGHLYNELKRLYIFLKCPKSEGFKQLRREQIFIEMLENVDPDDALLLIGMKDRRLPWPGLTYKLIKKAFPTISKDWPDDEPQYQK
jgi:hypothetical protein